MSDPEPTAISLAHADDFRLGSVFVRPSTRTVVGASGPVTIEPRVMQLLVALARADGDILSRDDLIQHCWGGVVVGENAIHRAVSQLRRVALTAGGGSFTIDTISRVGYRLVVSSPAGDHSGSAGKRAGAGVARPDRRTVLAGTALAGVAAIGGLAFLMRNDDGASPMAVDLVEKAEQEQKHGLPDSLEQATAYYRGAIDQSPNYAKAWGGLALTYAQALDSIDDEQLRTQAARCRSAANRALALDRDNIEAQAALLSIPPLFGRWNAMSGAVGALARRAPRHWYVSLLASAFDAEAGKTAPALATIQKAKAVDPFVAPAHLLEVRLLWARGRIEEAQSRLREAEQRWPAHWPIWNMAFQFHAYHGNHSEARSLLTDQRRTPFGLSPLAIPKRLAVLTARESRADADVRRVIADYGSEARASRGLIPNAAMMMAAVGADDEILDLFDGYYFARGRYSSPLLPLSRRRTGMLFLPAFDPVREHPRFKAVLKASGIA
jgi:DNA-binding winged helix-turn-helix (wHTH) protein/tetratricopeptide (TPR) repeat protein